MPHYRLCPEPNSENRSGQCGQWVHHWCQCPIDTCRKDIAYCDAHGGTDKAVAEMTAHIRTEHG